jgi:hypothetical protein
MLRAFAVSAILILPPISDAHHSFAIYSDQVTEIEGTLESVRWGNPHVRLTLQSDDGSNENWLLEAAAVYVLERRGLTRDLFEPGDQIRVAGRLHNGQAPEIWLHNILLPDGRELLMIGGVEPRWSTNVLGGDGRQAVVDTASSQSRGIFRVWSQPELRPIDYGEGLPYHRAPPQGGAAWIERMDGFAARCEPVGMPGIMATPYPFEFVDRGSNIQLIGFSNNARMERTIHLGNGAESESPALDRFGHSVGRWENAQELVVETKQIAWPYFDDSLGTPQSADMEIVEFFTLSDNQSRLDYKMIVADPATFSEPATAIQTYRLPLGESLEESSYCADQASVP